MTTSFKGSVQILIYYLHGSLFANETCRHRNAVAVVVLTSQMGYLGCPTKSTTYMGILVDSHLHTVATATDDNTTLVLAFLKGRTHLMGKVGIITTVGRMGAKIFYFKTTFTKVVDNFQF